MTIQHNKITYLIPIIIICFMAIVGVPSTIAGLVTLQLEGLGNGLAILFFAGVIALCCWINYKTNTLELKKGLVQGKRGWIKKITLSTAVSNISYCEYTKFLCFNKIRINAITGTYIFKNMSDAEEFVDMINEVQGG